MGGNYNTSHLEKTTTPTGRAKHGEREWRNWKDGQALLYQAATNVGDSKLT
jgi:hypothetical protein